MSVVAARGFRAAGIEAGIKPDGPDVAVIIADRPARAAGVFTQNLAAAPPVLVSRDHVADGRASAIVVNSGCANAATGARGRADARTMARIAADALSVEPTDVLVCSTGTIGPHLPMQQIEAGIEAAVSAAGSTPAHGTAAATAILTTDSVTKEATFVGDGWVVGGMAKGAGMLRPDLATMLAFITTDADIAASELDTALVTAVDGSFNSLNVDGCESTNDTVLVLASGDSGVRPEQGEFEAALGAVCRDLAMAMARDAEGASRLVTIAVSGARDDATARRLGRIVADSALVRASFFGGDPNWGRVLGALGSARSDVDIERVAIAYNGVTVAAEGVGVDHDEASLLDDCAEGDLALSVAVGGGPGTATIITTDLTPDYVVFNGERS
jgi:glutamate N-acetyltransferase/amino-acid N-acetyltransferase